MLNKKATKYLGRTHIKKVYTWINAIGYYVNVYSVELKISTEVVNTKLCLWEKSEKEEEEGVHT